MSFNVLKKFQCKANQKTSMLPMQRHCNSHQGIPTVNEIATVSKLYHDKDTNPLKSEHDYRTKAWNPQSSDSSGWAEAAALEAADVVAPASTSCCSTEQTHPCCVWKFVTTMQHAIKHGPLYSSPQNPFNVAMLFLELHNKHTTHNKHSKLLRSCRPLRFKMLQ